MTYVRRVPARHYCDLPPVFGTQDDWEFPTDLGRWDLRAPELKSGVRLPRVGDVWECDECGHWWVLRPSPYVNVMSPHWERKWRPWWRRRK